MKFECKICCIVREDTNNWGNGAVLAEHTECHECNYWMSKVRLMKSDPEYASRLAIIDDTMYYIGEEAPSQVRAGTMNIMLGMGGQEFKLRFEDGRSVTTANLWSQGSIPLIFRIYFPNNAVFSKEAENAS